MNCVSVLMTPAAVATLVPLHE